MPTWCGSCAASAGSVAMRMELVIRCEYGVVVPWVSRLDDGRIAAVAGPDRIVLATPVETARRRHAAPWPTSRSREGEEVSFVLDLVAILQARARTGFRPAR